MKQELIFQIVCRALRMQGWLRKNNERMEFFLSGLALGAIDAKHRTRLTTELYNARRDYEVTSLFDWEKKWFANDLPNAPAKILIGGAGSGREVTHLIHLGYQVVAFDPAKSYVEMARKRIRNSLCLGFFQGAYEDLIGITHRNPTFDNSIDDYAPYDAVILGWGSFNHVGLATSRVALLKKCRTLCPNGPLLLSFWMRGDDSQRKRGRLWDVGYGIGSKLAIPSQPSIPLSGGDEISSQSGFGHYFTRQELHALSESSGYRISTKPQGAYAGTFPHSTFVPIL
jgi:SAM-dependent methyltransferase